jgi:formylglycine-generating enzyme required for sulfatase activity
MIKASLAVCILSLSLGVSAIGPASAGILPTDGESQYELEFWESIKNSTHAEDYEAYLEAYPDGRFAPLAKARAARYKDSSPEPAQTPATRIDAMDAHYNVVSNANVRSQPSPRAERVGTLDKGKQVHVTGRVRDSNWYRVDLDGDTSGFVFGELLREPLKTAAPPPQPKPAPAAKPKPEAPPAPSPQMPAAKTAAAPRTASAASAVTRDCDACPELVVVQPGAFVMGDDGGDRSERPAHRVTIAYPFAIGKYEVTLGQWRACVEAGACRAINNAEGLSASAPAKDLSWNDAQQYLHWLSKLTGQNYRLPSEAEWEYAARAGTTSRYWWGDNMEVGKANCKGCGGDWSNEAPADVDAFPANPFGIHGMNGGVWEWVADCWNKSYAGAPTDGGAWNRSDCRDNVIRGGSWRNDQTYAHSASRFTYDTGVRYILNGFRVAKSL